nr:helix-hairpin-helix domain-containing protein [Anaerolineaceae bacterium]
LVGLAKQEEELFLPGKSDSVRLDEHSQGFYLIQRIRDEAHRFAITAHRQRRGKIGLASRLDAIPGVGPERRKALLQHFGSIENILAANVEEIAQIKGIGADLAQAIKTQLE